jgi:hypothetical protein
MTSPIPSRLEAATSFNRVQRSYRVTSEAFTARTRPGVTDDLTRMVAHLRGSAMLC